MSRTYNITEKRREGIVYNRIRFNNPPFELCWLPSDKEAEKNAIRSADLHVIKHKLKYKPRKLKKIT
jgi:hypothetical protein